MLGVAYETRGGNACGSLLFWLVIAALLVLEHWHRRGTMPKAAKLDESTLFRSVRDLELSPRTANCLGKARIHLVGELVQRTTPEMLKIPNFGHRSLGEIEEALADMGLSLGLKIDANLQKRILRWPTSGAYLKTLTKAPSERVRAMSREILTLRTRLALAKRLAKEARSGHKTSYGVHVRKGCALCDLLDRWDAGDER